MTIHDRRQSSYFSKLFRHFPFSASATFWRALHISRRMARFLTRTGTCFGRMFPKSAQFLRKYYAVNAIIVSVLTSFFQPPQAGAGAASFCRMLSEKIKKNNANTLTFMFLVEWSSDRFFGLIRICWSSGVLNAKYLGELHMSGYRKNCRKKPQHFGRRSTKNYQ